MYPKYSDLLGFKEIIDFNFDNVYLINRPEKYGVLLESLEKRLEELQKYIHF